MMLRLSSAHFKFTLFSNFLYIVLCAVTFFFFSFKYNWMFIYSFIQGSKLTLATSHFASEFHQKASAKLYHTHFSATRTLALIIHEFQIIL